MSWAIDGKVQKTKLLGTNMLKMRFNSETQLKAIFWSIEQNSDRLSTSWEQPNMKHSLHLAYKEKIKR